MFFNRGALGVFCGVAGLLIASGCGSGGGGGTTDTRPADDGSADGKGDGPRPADALDAMIPDSLPPGDRPVDQNTVTPDSRDGAEVSPPADGADATGDDGIPDDGGGTEEDAAPDIGESPDVPPPLTIDDVCADFGDKACERINACAPALLQKNYGTVKVCSDRLRIGCLIDAKAPGARVFENPLHDCIQKFPDATCSDVLNDQVLTSCYPAGARPASAACGSHSQCASGYCRIAAGTCGVCTARAADGAKCDSTREDNRQCAAGLVCAANICVVPAASGKTCDDNTKPCLRLLSCVAGSCVAAGDTGDTCADDKDCNNWSGFYCTKDASATEGKCQKVTLISIGSRCTAAGPPCVAAGVCGPASGGDRCLEAAKDDFVCGGPGDAGVSSGPGCLLPARCLDKLCTLPSPFSCN